MFASAIEKSHAAFGLVEEDAEAVKNSLSAQNSGDCFMLNEYHRYPHTEAVECEAYGMAVSDQVCISYPPNYGFLASGEPNAELLSIPRGQDACCCARSQYDKGRGCLSAAS